MRRAFFDSKHTLQEKLSRFVVRSDLNNFFCVSKGKTFYRAHWTSIFKYITRNYIEIELKKGEN